MYKCPLDNAIPLFRSRKHRRWSFRVNSIKGRVVTKAMLGRLSGNPNVLDHFSEATVSRQL